MSVPTIPQAIRTALTEQEIAQAIRMSLGWVRADRRAKRIIPFFKLGRAVRYDLDTVRRALQSRMEVGSK